MKKKVNTNFICAKLFVDQLVNDGLKYVCISPGSRSTPLTSAFAADKKIKTFINIDERSSAFFAVGIAKSKNLPVAIVTTSGTAVAELYPAIIEAFQSRVPLIICSTDRPAYLRNSGANQTINQDNIFKNHIRWFYQMKLPSLKRKDMLEFRKIAKSAIHISTELNKGPVHINFQFEKPLEPSTYNSVIDTNVILSVKKEKILFKPEIISRSADQLKKLAKKIAATKKGWIVAGPMIKDKSLFRKIILLSEKTGYPVFADGISNIRSIKHKNIFTNYNLFLNSTTFRDQNEPDLILQFGRTPISSVLEKIFQKSNIPIYTINIFGDRFDSRKKSAEIIKMNPVEFCDQLISEIIKSNKIDSGYINNFFLAETESKIIKDKFLARNNSKIEPVLLNEIINNLPSKTNVIIGNSLPVRDLDNFINYKNDIEFYFNRGASGIDGVTSTALGIAVKKNPAILVTGDLSFLHDLNALMIAKKYPIALTVFLINNNGGAIFRTLPVFSEKIFFNDYFLTPQNLDIKSIVSAFGLKYIKLKSNSHLKELASTINRSKNFQIVEIVTDPANSHQFREAIFSKIENKITKIFK